MVNQDVLGLYLGFWQFASEVDPVTKNGYKVRTARDKIIAWRLCPVSLTVTPGKKAKDGDSYCTADDLLFNRALSAERTERLALGLHSEIKMLYGICLLTQRHHQLLSANCLCLWTSLVR